MANNPINNTDPTGHTIQSDDGYVPTDPATYIRNATLHQYGITLSDKGSKKWTLDNMRLVYDSLSIINTHLDGQLKTLAGGGIYKMGEYKPDGEHTYSGWTTNKNITFYTMGDKAIHQMNIYHEMGHVIDNSSQSVCSNALGDDANKSTYITNGYVSKDALKSMTPNDPTYGTKSQAKQASSTDPTEQWADAFANYVADNINLNTTAGQNINTLVTTELDVR